LKLFLKKIYNPLSVRNFCVKMDIERRVLEMIRGEKKAPIAMACLAVLSLLYRSVVSLRNMAYDGGVFSSEKLCVPVISVGNVVAGGTGKTPFVHLLASRLQDKVRLGILTRGFRSDIEKSGLVKQIAYGNGPLFSAKHCGDEPYLLAKKISAPIWVGADRTRSGRIAIAQGVNCLILDDAMQHRRLKRDFEIVIVDANDPFSKGRYLPWGLLRDSPKRLKNATLIIVSHVKGDDHFGQIKAAITPLSDSPLIGVRTEVLEKEKFTPRKVGVFCGIGQPARFLQAVRDLNQEIVDTLILKDHAVLSKGQLENFAKRCLQKGAEVLLCTEKDFVKLYSGNASCLDIVAVEVKMKIVAGQEYWDPFIDNILDKVVK
jgi:tetraacyldisaccharide 4'-kinase